MLKHDFPQNVLPVARMDVVWCIPVPEGRWRKEFAGSALKTGKQMSRCLNSPALSQVKGRLLLCRNFNPGRSVISTRKCRPAHSNLWLFFWLRKMEKKWLTKRTALLQNGARIQKSFFPLCSARVYNKISSRKCRNRLFKAKTCEKVWFCVFIASFPCIFGGKTCTSTLEETQQLSNETTTIMSSDIDV